MNASEMIKTIRVVADEAPALRNALSPLRSGRIVCLPYPMTDPASTLRVDGASLLGNELTSHG